MAFSLKIILLMSVLTITVVLFYLSWHPSYLLQVSVEPRFTKGLEMRRDIMTMIANGRDPVFLDIAGEVSNPTVSKVSVSIRAPDKGEFAQRGVIKVSGGSFLGTIQLGSTEQPIMSDEDYSYIIDSAADNSRLSEGVIHLRIRAVISYLSRASMAIMAGLGLIASVLQVVQFITSNGPKRSESLPTFRVRE